MVRSCGKTGSCRTGCVFAFLLGLALLVSAQSPPTDPTNQTDPQANSPELVETGQATAAGHSVPYLIRRLPVSSFPELPDEIADALTSKGCLIPQTYEARRPENVVHASLERSGSSDWAVLCSARGTVSLLVFLQSAPAAAVVLASAVETDRLQDHVGTSTLGFNWGIDPASAASVRQAQLGSNPHSRLLDHEALADSVIDHATIYHVYNKGAWTSVKMPQ